MPGSGVLILSAEADSPGSVSRYSHYKPTSNQSQALRGGSALRRDTRASRARIFARRRRRRCRAKCRPLPRGVAPPPRAVITVDTSSCHLRFVAGVCCCLLLMSEMPRFHFSQTSRVKTELLSGNTTGLLF